MDPGLIMNLGPKALGICLIYYVPDRKHIILGPRSFNLSISEPIEPDISNPPNGREISEPGLVPPIAVREPLILDLAPDKDPGAVPVAESLLVADLCPDCFPSSSPHHIIIGRNTRNQQFVRSHIIKKKWFSPSLIDPEPEALLGRTKTRVASHPLARDEVEPEGKKK